MFSYPEDSRHQSAGKVGPISGRFIHFSVLQLTNIWISPKVMRIMRVTTQGKAFPALHLRLYKLNIPFSAQCKGTVLPSRSCTRVGPGLTALLLAQEIALSKLNPLLGPLYRLINKTGIINRFEVPQWKVLHSCYFRDWTTCRGSPAKPA